MWNVSITTCATGQPLQRTSDTLPKMEVIRMVQRVCKQTRAGCDCCDSFCVLRRSSAVPRFFRVKPIWFFGKKEKRKKTGKKERKGRTKGRLCQNTLKTIAKKGRGKQLCKASLAPPLLCRKGKWLDDKEPQSGPKKKKTKKKT